MVSEHMRLFLVAELRNAEECGIEPTIAMAAESLVQMPDDVAYENGWGDARDLEAELDEIAKEFGEDMLIRKLVSGKKV